MSKLAIEKLATELSTPLASYDASKWSLGTLIKRFTGAGALDNFITPNKIAMARPMEESTPIPLLYPHAITISDTIDWVFGIENIATATATRRIVCYEYNKVTCTYNWKGFITMTLNNATAHTQRGFRVARYLHSTGTVAVSGTAVTGVLTTFSSDRLAVGARIGFGSTDPTQITQWYYISAIGSNLGLTLSASAGTITAGTSYVIEELRPMVVTTNATTTNGGLFVAKGVTIDDFISTGTTISASASTVDNLKLVYWLADASTVTNTVGAGLCLDDQVSKTDHSVYVLDGTASVRVFKYNVRGAGTITAGKMVLTGSDIVITGAQAVTGTNSQANNGRIATAQHGAGSGVKSIYFVTTTRIYRASVSNITAGNSSWQSENRTEVPVGGSATYPATSLLNSIEYLDSIDMFIVMTTSATGQRSYFTKYPTTSGDPFSYMFTADFKQQDQSTADSNSTPIPVNTMSLAFGVWSENGITHMLRQGGTTAVNHQLYAIPFGAHEDFSDTTNQYAISPEIQTPNASSMLRVMVENIKYVGIDNLKYPLEGIKLYYRTSGISDNSGSWTAIDDSGSISGAGAPTSIQFKITFKVISAGTCIPARIVGLTCIYEDLSTDAHYQPSATFTDTTTKAFAWRFSTAFGGTVPDLRVRLYDAETNGLLIDDSTASPTGTFEQSTNLGGSWSAWTSTDKANEDTFIRYIPASLADNIKVRALLTLA